MVVLVEADELVRLRHLIRDFFGVKPRQLFGDGGRFAIRHEGIQRQLVVDLAARRRVEPELVPDDAAAQVGAGAVAVADARARIDAERPQIVVDVVGLILDGRLVERRVAVEGVAAGLHQRVQIDAAAGHFRAVTDGADCGLLDRRIVPIVRLAAVGLQTARLHAFQR